MLGLAAAPAHAWTWNDSPCPLGSVDVSGGASGAGAIRWRGYTFVPGAGHMSQVLGEDQREYTCRWDAMLGKVAYRVASGYTDYGLIATGTDEVAPNIRVSDEWTNAPINDIARGNGDLPAGSSLCHSGVSVATKANGGFRCGTLSANCLKSANAGCIVSNPNGIVTGGDSGGPVWWYHPDGGVKLAGWLTHGYGARLASGDYVGGVFQPTWKLLSFSFEAQNTWTAGGFQTGRPSTTGACFVTTRGCLVP